MFKVNDKVVCVDDSGDAPNGEIHGWSTQISNGVVYAVEGVGPPAASQVVCYGLSPSAIGVKLVGVIPMYDQESMLGAYRFRPLSEVKAENAAKREQERQRNMTDEQIRQAINYFDKNNL